MTSVLLPKDIEELVRTNEPLSDLHAASVKDCLEEQIPLLEQYEKEVEDLAKLLHTKRQQIVQIRLGIQACKRVLELSKETTIFTVPTEVLQVIFCYSLPTKLSACFKHPSNYSANPPFSLVQVCRRWRTVALEMPSLWTLFSIRSHIYRPVEVLNAGAEPFFNFVRGHFQRSGDLPKSVDVYLPFNYGAEGGCPLDDGSLLRAVFSQDVKIKNLSFGTYNICHLLSKLDSDSSSLFNPSILESVESLVLYSTGNHGSRGRRDQIRMPFSPDHFKSLRRLSLEPGDRHISSLPFPIPWGNLTHLVITSWIPWQPWLNLFTKLTALQEGIFYITDSGRWEFNESTIENHKAQLPDLSDLTLIFHRPDPAVLFPTFSFPSLKHLRLGAHERSKTYRDDDGPFRLHNMGSYLSNLTALSLYHLSWQMKETHIVELLTLTPNLRSLTLGVDADYNALLLRLYSTGGHGQSSKKPLIVPLLEEFTIDCVSIDYKNSNTYHHREPDPYAITFRTVPDFSFRLSHRFINMVRARWSRWTVMGVSRLKKVTLFLEERYKAEVNMVRNELSYEVKEGLDLTLGVAKKPYSWIDPFNKSMTHWHDGLVLPDSEPTSDCATCLRLAREAEEKREKERLVKVMTRNEDEDEEDDVGYCSEFDNCECGECSQEEEDSDRVSDLEDWY